MCGIYSLILALSAAMVVEARERPTSNKFSMTSFLFSHAFIRSQTATVVQSNST